MPPTIDNLLHDPLGLDTLGPPPSRDPRWFVPAHAAWSSSTASLSVRQTAIARSAPIPAPREVSRRGSGPSSRSIASPARPRSRRAS